MNKITLGNLNTIVSLELHKAVLPNVIKPFINYTSQSHIKTRLKSRYSYIDVKLMSSSINDILLFKGTGNLWWSKLTKTFDRYRTIKKIYVYQLLTTICH